MKDHDLIEIMREMTLDFDPGCLLLGGFFGGLFTLVALAIICSSAQQIIEVLAR